MKLNKNNFQDNILWRINFVYSHYNYLFLRLKLEGDLSLILHKVSRRPYFKNSNIYIQSEIAHNFPKNNIVFPTSMKISVSNPTKTTCC